MQPEHEFQIVKFMSLLNKIAKYDLKYRPSTFKTLSFVCFIPLENSNLERSLMD